MTAPACGSCTAPVTDAYLCAGCTRDLAGQLLLAASIAPDLDDAIAKLLKRGSGGPRSEADAPLPIDLAASDAATALRRHLGYCTGAILTAGMIPPLTYGTADMARWLAEHRERIRQHQRGAQYHRDITAAVHRALAVIDRKPERAPAGQCDGCGRQLLAELGADEVTCACGMTLVGLIEQRYERAAKADLIDTPQAIAGALKALGTSVLPSTIRTWATRGRLTRHGERYGQPVYSMADVMELCAKRTENVRATR